MAVRKSHTATQVASLVVLSFREWRARSAESPVVRIPARGPIEHETGGKELQREHVQTGPTIH